MRFPSNEAKASEVNDNAVKRREGIVGKVGFLAAVAWSVDGNLGPFMCSEPVDVVPSCTWIP